MANYKRILVKISGEAMSANKHGINAEAVEAVAQQIKQVVSLGVQVGIVMGGGNFWRGRSSERMKRVVADQIGMLATVMNSLALGDALTNCGVKNKVYSSVTIDKVTSPYIATEAANYLEQGYVVIFGGGTGAPFFSTDTAAVLRACEIGAEALFCAKAVDGVYDSDPTTNPNAKKFDELTFDTVISNNLKALDLTAVAMAREFGIAIVAFGKNEPNGLLRILKGEKLGTIIH